MKWCRWTAFFFLATWLVTVYLYWVLTASSSGTGTDAGFLSEPSRSDAPVVVAKGLDEGSKSEKRHRIPFAGNSLQSIAKKRKIMPVASKDIPKRHYDNWKPTPIAASNESDSATSPRIAVDESRPDLGIIRTAEDKRIKDEGYRLFAFNALVSQRIGDTRSIPDTRNPLCARQPYPDAAALPDASVVMCFHNEHVPTLARSVRSILERTPPPLLAEVVLVNDLSDAGSTRADVERYAASLADADRRRVRLLHTERREGLIRARTIGAAAATGRVLVFLDSHVEVNAGWLQPLLAHLAANASDAWSPRVAVPVIDIVDGDTFQYKPSPLVKGGFNWGLHYKWDNVPRALLQTKEDFVKPIKTPTMAGGLFAIYREYFDRMGKYDTGMDTWGGENLEISFRIWMCGGELAIVPCSRIGHVFRSRRPYGSPSGKDTMMHNSLRMAHVWMDSYIDLYYKRVPQAMSEDFGDVSDRIALRKSLNCKSFQWYLDNVYPEMILDTDGENEVKKKIGSDENKFQPWYARSRDYTDSFRIKLSNTSLCIQPAKDIKTKGGSLVLGMCSRNINQIWFETSKKELLLQKVLCLEASSSGDGLPTLSKCHEMAGNQEWHHKAKNGEFIYNMAAGTCLGVEEKVIGAPVSMVICLGSNKILWDFVRI